MLLSIIIIFILFMAILRGLHRGLVLELLYTFGYLIVFFTARYYSSPFAHFLNKTFGGWSNNAVTNTTIMNSIAFITLMIVGWIIIRALARISTMITWLPVIKQVNGLAGAVVAFVISYLITFVVLSISQFIPNDFYQSQLSQSVVSQTILSKTPGISSHILNNYIIQTQQTKNAL